MVKCTTARCNNKNQKHYNRIAGAGIPVISEGKANTKLFKNQELYPV